MNPREITKDYLQAAIQRLCEGIADAVAQAETASEEARRAEASAEKLHRSLERTGQDHSKASAARQHAIAAHQQALLTALQVRTVQLQAADVIRIVAVASGAFAADDLLQFLDLPPAQAPVAAPMSDDGTGDEADYSEDEADTVDDEDYSDDNDHAVVEAFPRAIAPPVHAIVGAEPAVESPTATSPEELTNLIQLGLLTYDDFKYLAKVLTHQPTYLKTLTDEQKRKLLKYLTKWAPIINFPCQIPHQTRMHLNSICELSFYLRECNNDTYRAAKTVLANAECHTHHAFAYAILVNRAIELSELAAIRRLTIDHYCKVAGNQDVLLFLDEIGKRLIEKNPRLQHYPVFDTDKLDITYQWLMNLGDVETTPIPTFTFALKHGFHQTIADFMVNHLDVLIRHVDQNPIENLLRLWICFKDLQTAASQRAGVVFVEVAEKMLASNLDDLHAFYCTVTGKSSFLSGQKEQLGNWIDEQRRLVGVDPGFIPIATADAPPAPVEEAVAAPEPRELEGAPPAATPVAPVVVAEPHPVAAPVPVLVHADIGRLAAIEAEATAAIESGETLGCIRAVKEALSANEDFLKQLIPTHKRRLADRLNAARQFDFCVADDSAACDQILRELGAYGLSAGAPAVAETAAPTPAAPAAASVVAAAPAIAEAVRPERVAAGATGETRSSARKFVDRVSFGVGRFFAPRQQQQAARLEAKTDLTKHLDTNGL